MAIFVRAEQAVLYDLTPPVAGQTLWRRVTGVMSRYCHVLNPVQGGLTHFFDRERPQLQAGLCAVRVRGSGPNFWSTQRTP